MKQCGSDAKNFYAGSSDSTPQNNQEISYTIANSGREDEAEVGTKDAPQEQRSPWCPLFYLLIIPVYTILGALMFRLCENAKATELMADYRNRCKPARDEKLAVLRRRFDVAMADNASLAGENLSFEDINNAIIEVDTCLRNRTLQQQIPPHEFDYFSSGVYTVSVLTTVGYGDIVPRTLHGRIATMMYASIGIPLYIAFNADFGEWIMARMVCAYSKIRRLYFRVIKKRTPTIEERLRPVSEMTKFLIVLMTVVVFLLLHAVSTMMLENATGTKRTWTYMDAVYFLYSTVTLVGFGDLTIDNDYIFIFVQFPILLFGQAIVALYYYYIQNAIRYKIPAIVEKWYDKRYGEKKDSKSKTSQVSTGAERDGSRERRRRSRRRFRKLRKALLGRKDTESSEILLPTSDQQTPAQTTQPTSAQNAQQTSTQNTQKTI